MADSINRAQEHGLPHVAPVLDGQEMTHSGGDVVDVINPATGKPVARQACCDDGDVDQLVQSADRAYRGDAWRKLTPSARGLLLLKYADVIEKHAEELIELELLDTGKPIAQLRGGELPLAAAIIRFYAGAADKIEGAVKATSSGSFDLTFWEPYGVVAGILPWNYPLVNVAMKLAPALAAGNAIVLKPSIETPLAAVAMAKLCREAGIPDGIVNVALGPGSRVGNALVAHPKVKKVSFTGSTQVGQAIQKQAADQMKAVNLELGGKNAIVVFDDADLERAADAVLFSGFVNAGQLCVSCSRLLVQASIADKFEQLLLEKVKRVKVGDPRDEATLVGPMITKSQYDTALRYIEAGKGEGCRVLCGGGAAQPGGDLAGGYWLATTILSGCTPDMKVAREEIFGPALAVMRFKDEADAIDIANGVSYGLSGSVWTCNNARALRMVRAMDTGLIWVNSMLAGYPQIPLAPHKMSGTGVELGIEGLLAYCKRKSAILAYDDDAPVGWGLASS
jgi:acyl-CoA reductase-like NAD-dependent aldehyde dehydrogenase